MKSKLLILLLMITTVSISQESDQKQRHYIINGSASFSEPVMFPESNVRIGASFNVSGAYSCGDFNFQNSIASQLSNAGQRLRTQIVGAVQGLIAALPEILLQRIRPDLYDLYQKLMIRAEADVRFAYQSCESWKRAFSDKDKGVTEVLKEAVAVDWEVQATTGGNDIWLANENADERKAEKGIKWCDGSYRGGKNTSPLEPTSDVAIAGFNIILRRSCTSNSRVVASKANQQVSGLLAYFPSVQTVKTFVYEVLGDYIFKANETGVREGSIPQGLEGLITLKQAEIEHLLTEAVQQPSAGQARDLLQLEIVPNGGKIVYEILEALSSMDSGIRALTIKSLSSELASQYVITKTLHMKKILKASKYIPEFKASNFITTTIDDALADLDQQMKDLMFEKQVRESFYSDTAGSIINRYVSERKEGTSLINNPNDNIKIRDGGVVRDND